MCVCLCIPPAVVRQRLGNNPLIVTQWLGKSPPIIAGQRLGRNVTAVTNTHAIIEELLDPAFSVFSMRSLSKESRRLVLPRTSCILCESYGFRGK
jgi:hypothetical protein